MKITSSTKTSLADQLKELWQYRELILTFVVRDLKARYRQTTIGISWAIIQPLFMTGVFTLIFSKFLNVSTGGVPYPIFAFIAMTTWTFFARTITAGSSNLLGNYGIFSKVYFPRIIIPLATVLSSLIDFMIASLFALILLIIYQIPIDWQIILLPIIFLEQILLGASFSILAAGLTIIFRDLRFALPFLVQLSMYASPVIYSVRNLQAKYKILFLLNPITGVIEGYRSILLYQEIPNTTYLLISLISSLLILVLAYIVFKKIEKYLADIV